MNKGIWKYDAQLRPHIEQKYRFTLFEGNTPIEKNNKIAKKFGLKELFIKREDLNPTGSHKDRGLAFQISAHVQEGKREFAISSSGNAAISAINILKNTEYSLHIFLSSKLQVAKIHRLVKAVGDEVSSDIFKGKDTVFENFNFYFSQKPLSNLFSFCKDKEVVSLRGSTDEYGYEGFKTIAYEIFDIDADSLFLPVSSGTSAKGIFEGYEENKKIIPFHLVQTTKVNTLVHRFDKDYTPSVNSIADAIVDRIGHRVREIEDIIKTSDGSGWIIGDQEIQKAQEVLKDSNILTSNESAMTLAAVIKAKEKGWDIKRPICIFTGTV
jgi:threonine synthase